MTIDGGYYWGGADDVNGGSFWTDPESGYYALLADMKAYLGDDYNENMSAQLSTCVSRAILSFKTYMNYPAAYMVVDEQTQLTPCDKHMNENYYCIFDLCLYFWNLMGMEYQTEHRESGSTLVFNTEATVYATHGVVPFATVM